jgi:DNA-binding beta-propeller fold protein YncE
MKDDEWVDAHQGKGDFSKGVFIINEGNYMYGNSTLSFYDPVKKQITNNLFYDLNGLPLGDVGQSMSLSGNKGYIVINNSGKIYIIDISTGKYTGKITGLSSPRYIQFINNNKAYITDLYAGKISVFDPETNKITGSISTKDHLSTEQMVQIGDQIFVTCWSFDNTILVIDSKRDTITAEYKTGKQPGSIVVDKENKLWVMCDGGWGKNGIGTALLQKINPVSGTIELSLNLPPDVNAKRLAINGTRDTLFFIDKGIWKMAVNADKLPASPFIPNKQLFYGLAVNPVNSEVYFSDAIDYSQKGIVYRYSSSGAPIDSFKTGITPGAFCFK